MIKWLKQHLCFHDWQDECLCGDIYKELCPTRKKFNECRTHYIGMINFYCDYHYFKCRKCGKEK